MAVLWSIGVLHAHLSIHAPGGIVPELYRGLTTVPENSQDPGTFRSRVSTGLFLLIKTTRATAGGVSGQTI